MGAAAVLAHEGGDESGQTAAARTAAIVAAGRRSSATVDERTRGAARHAAAPTLGARSGRERRGADEVPGVALAVHLPVQERDDVSAGSDVRADLVDPQAELLAQLAPHRRRVVLPGSCPPLGVAQTVTFGNSKRTSMIRSSGSSTAAARPSGCAGRQVGDVALDRHGPSSFGCSGSRR